MRFTLLIMAGICLYQSSVAETLMDKHMKRPAQIELNRLILSLALKEKIDLGNIILDKQGIAAIIQEYLNNPHESCTAHFIHCVKSLLREKTAQLSNEQINKIAQALYVRAIEISRGRELSDKQINQLLDISQYQETTQSFLKISGYMWNLTIQETVRTAFDYVWSLMSDSDKK